MQFKHPEILYFLVLLIIPILVHLFQLQRYKRIPFTNVAFLKKIVSQTRRSSQLKKWLILSTRLLLFTALIFAFSKPYFGEHDFTTIPHHFIYLDNSLSTNSNGEKGNLLKVSSQDLIESLRDGVSYTLLTNDNEYQNVTASELKLILLHVKNTSKQCSLGDVILKLETMESSSSTPVTDAIFISDFQNITNDVFSTYKRPLSIVHLSPELKSNISIDSVYITARHADAYDVHIRVRNQGRAKKSIPLALFNDELLVSKQTFSIEDDSSKILRFSIQSEDIFKGRVSTPFKDVFDFDNNFYFTIQKNNKIDVLAIGKPDDFLSKIYTSKEFKYTFSKLKNVNYNSLEAQQLIILNGIDVYPETFIKTLIKCAQNGGDL